MRIQDHNHWLNGKHTLPGSLAQLCQQLQGMTEPGRLYQQAVWPGLAQQATQPHLKRRTVDTAQTPTRDFRQGNPVFAGRQQGSIDADLAKLIDQHCPALASRLLRHQVTDQRGFACPQRAGNDMGRDILEHEQWL
ncbi:hypothetical protein D3C85_988500 [compost metagenome]